MSDRASDGHAGEVAPRLALTEMAMGFMRGKLLCAAVRLGIADALAAGPRSVAQLAEATSSHAGALHRLLRALASIDVVTEVAPSLFRLTPRGESLRRDTPDSAWASMVFWADLLADAWTYLPDCIRAGDRSGADAAREREGATSRWSREPDAPAIFHAVFAEPRAEDFAVYAAAWDFSRARILADLGGGGGGLLAALLQAQPDARGILVDRPEALDGAARRFAAAGLTPRCELVAGDLLESVPTSPDVYLMRCVLHGYDDDTARKILRNVRRAMQPEDRLLVLEVVLPDRIDRPDPALEKLLLSDINMLAVTGGRERSEAEWRILLESAGLQLRQILAMPGQMSHLIETARQG